MSKLEDRVREENEAWWAAHPDFRTRFASSGIATADSLARSVVHWHHNVESSQRYQPEQAENDRYFLRGYAIAATRTWLCETQDKLDAYMKTPHMSHWYQTRDLECLVRNLQRSLDDFEHNGFKP